MRILKFGIFAAALWAGSHLHTQAAVETYAIDPVHSSVDFSIRHFVSKVPGKFASFTGTINFDRENPANSSVMATIDATSLNTANQKRDQHVKSPDFLDTAKYATIVFKSTSWKASGDDAYQVAGDLTIKDVTKPVVLNVKLLGIGPGMQGMTLSGWEATTTIKKSEFNAGGPAMLGKAVGDDVEVHISIEADKK